MSKRPMATPGWTFKIAACLLTAPGCHAWAQQAAPDSTRSTLAGVYTAEQAARGADTYAGACRACHTPDSHTGPAFRIAWAGRPLSDLFGYISELMPKNEPGTLTPREYSQVLAYLLSLNGMPAGAEELPTDAKVLTKIRVDTAATRSPRREGSVP